MRWETSDEAQRRGTNRILSDNNLYFDAGTCSRPAPVMLSSLLCTALARKHGNWSNEVDLTAEITQIGGRQRMMHWLRWLPWIPTKSRTEFRFWDSEHGAFCCPWPLELGCELPLKSEVNPKNTASATPTTSSCWDIWGVLRQSAIHHIGWTRFHALVLSSSSHTEGDFICVHKSWIKSLLHQRWVHLHYHFISILGWKTKIWKQIFWLPLIFYTCNHIVEWSWSTQTGCLMAEIKPENGLWEGTMCALRTNRCSVHRAGV